MADVTALAGTQAYAKALNNAIGARGAGESLNGTEAAAGPSFAELLAEAGQSAIETGVGAEKVSLESITGDAGLADIVTAVSNAEAIIEPVVAVRDRVIQAYEDIIKMPIEGCTLLRQQRIEAMNTADVVDVVREAIWVLLIVASPVMLVALGVGLIIALIQALTQVQEMTLVFVPKILAIFLSLIVFMPFMISSMIELMEQLAQRIAGLG